MLTHLFYYLVTMSGWAPTWMDTAKSDLTVTSGSVTQTRSAYLTVVGSKERAQRNAGTHHDAMLQFRYRGPSKTTSPLASGGVVRQIGLKMRTKDTCNLLYLMWRIEPVEEIAITIKSNPGKSTHDDCGAGGYIPVTSIPLKDIGVTATTQESHRLRAKIDEKNGEFKLTVDIDEKTVWSGALDPKFIAPINGPVGFRSDNGSFIFKLFVTDEQSK